MNTADTRLWRCPECGEVERISIQIEDPMICSDCMLNVSERNQDTKKEKPASPIFDDKKKSFLSDLSPKTITIGICITFFFVMTLIGMIGNALKPNESKQVREIALQTTITEKNTRKSKQPQKYINRIPIVSRLSEAERKVIYKAIMSAFESAEQDPEWKRLDYRIDNGARNGERSIDLGRMVDRQNEIDGRYLQTHVWDPFGITEKEQITIYYEGIKKRW